MMNNSFYNNMYNMYTIHTIHTNYMIDKYIKTLIKNLPDNSCRKKGDSDVIDLILDGGIFNGSYLIGALLFLKEMENQHFIRVDKISGCSIGSIAAILYHLNALHLASEIYDILLDHFKTHFTLNVFDVIFAKLEPIMPDDICNTMTNRVYITYYNVEKCKKIVKSKYKSKADIFNTIRKSCFFPFIIDGSVAYKNKYCDGFNPYILPTCPHKKILYLDLFGNDKIGSLFSVKNEKTNFHRILAGLLDVHLFFIKRTNTQMCSYVNDWSIKHLIHNRVSKVVVEKLLFYSIYFYMIIRWYIPENMGEFVVCKMGVKIMREIYITLIENYSL